MDIATLGVEVDSRPVVKGTQDLDRFGDQAATTERQVQSMGRTSSRSFVTTARGARGLSQALAGPGIRNASLQLSQVAQQASATGNFVQALAIQLPDLTLGFGPLGIAAGVAAGALLPFAANMLGAGDASDLLGDRMESLEAIMSSLDQSMDILEASASELRDRYGEAADSVRLFAERQARLRLSQLNGQLQEQSDILQDAAKSFTIAQNAGSTYQRTLDRIQREFGLTRQAAREFESTLQTAASANTINEQAIALDRVFDLLEANGVAASDIPPELALALDEMITLIRRTREAEEVANSLSAQVGNVASGIGGAADEAARLASNLLAASAIEQSVGIRSGVADGSLPPQALGDDPLGVSTQSAATNRALQEILAQRRQREQAERRARSTGGGSGRSEADRKQIEMLRERDRILDSLKTAQDRYNDSVAQADKLLAAGVLTQADYNRHIDQLQTELAEAEFGEVYQAIEDISQSFSDAIVNGESFGDAIGNIMRRVASDILSSGIREALTHVFDVPNLGSGGGGGLLGGLLQNIFLPARGPLPVFNGGGFTGHGARSGGVDGRGGFPAILHPNETVIDHTRQQVVGQGMSAVPSIVFAPNIDASGQDPSVVARIEASMERANAEFEARTIETIRNAQKKRLL